MELFNALWWMFWLLLIIFAVQLIVSRGGRRNRTDRSYPHSRTYYGSSATDDTGYTGYTDYQSTYDPSPPAESGLSYEQSVCEPGSYYEPAADSCVPTDYSSSYDAGDCGTSYSDAGGCGASYSDSGGSSYSDSCSGGSSD